ncbi:MAG: ABC transporter substrate-binding protein [Pseudorhodoplanes sp.]|nr:ABC transporter substrate-binding protein [Pseudorhodoplanes sp.]
MKMALCAAGAVLALAAAPAAAQDKIKIGFVSTFSGPTAVIGNDMRNSFELALDHLGRKMGGKDVEVIYEDDQQKPEVGLQKTQKLIQSDKVDFVVGYIWSNVLLASYKPVVESQTFLIGANAGPHQLAGEQCSPFFFSTSWQNDQTPQAMGLYMNQKGVKSVYLIGPNYAAGKDMLAGVASTFKGQIVGQDLTKWPDQLDFSAELSKARAANPEAIFVFYPGAAGAQFLNQYVQAGLKGKIPLYTAFTIDELTLPRQGDAALGVPGAQEWVNDLPNDANRKFVADYRKKHADVPGPTFYGAQSYDAAMLIDSAVKGTKGNLSDKNALRAELKKANFKSVRGNFKYGNNHFPIQNFYLQEAVKNPDGKLALKTVSTIVENDQDRFHEKCPMK